MKESKLIVTDNHVEIARFKGGVRGDRRGYRGVINDGRRKLDLG